MDFLSFSFILFFCNKIQKHINMFGSLHLQNRSWRVYVISSWYHRVWLSLLRQRVLVFIAIRMVRANRLCIFIYILHKKKKLTMVWRNPINCSGRISRRSNLRRFRHFHFNLEYMIKRRIFDHERRCVTHTFGFVKGTVRTLVKKTINNQIKSKMIISRVALIPRIRWPFSERNLLDLQQSLIVFFEKFYFYFFTLKLELAFKYISPWKKITAFGIFHLISLKFFVLTK